MAITTLVQDVQYVTGQTKIATEVFLYFLEGEMRVIAEASLHMSDRDENGIHQVKDRYCQEDGPCFSFDCNGRKSKGCERFRQQPTGVKLCVKL